MQNFNLQINYNQLYADFNLFPKINQLSKDFKQPTEGHLFQIKQYKLVQDIIDSYSIKPLVINDQDRPEYIAYKLYGSVEYFWIILVCNNLLNPYYEWIMPQEQLYEYCKQKYKNLPQKENTIFYHKNEKDQKYYNVEEYPKDSKLWYDKLDTNHLNLQYKGTLVPVTYLEHEIELNEEKRIVNVLDPNDFTQFIQDLINEGLLVK